ncbi:MAG: flagellar brake protein [Deltaproteobacteria bacterium]|nr:flagellar brake protein [Deltaproteobacteria bacterium]
MAWHTLKSRQEIVNILDHVMGKGVPITLRIEGKEKSFQSKIIKIDHEAAGREIGGAPQLIVEKLVPDDGNALIQSFPGVVVEFSVNHGLYRCSINCTGSSSEYPCFGFILSFPETMEIDEKRKARRVLYDMPEMVSVEFTVDKGPAKGKMYELGVIDCSRHGLGILIREKDFDLLESVDPGDELRNIIFYATWARIRVDGIVRHKTKIADGKYRGCYILGIESRDIIESCHAKNP